MVIRVIVAASLVLLITTAQASQQFKDWEVDRTLASSSLSYDKNGNAGFAAFIINKADNTMQIGYVIRDNKCSSETDAVDTVMNVDGQSVKATTYCLSKGSRKVMAQTSAGMRYIGTKFLKQTTVSMNGVIFSARGFSEAYRQAGRNSAF
ncbi:hypothetical protein [Endozoicomonas ascidiicola]|uniref:hypothetical protein n=1 Tax=Endozoicomonas ascidiicola TaxID=1698521 RepID=UPI0008359C0E|nr:hypothetical protein [Endozoicomonas ascidiicola]